MPEYQVLARKYRPKLFGDVVGQEAIVTTLKNAIRLKRTAHAYLFCGCRGTGKTTLARLFAMAMNCPHLSESCEPCGSCPSCKEIAAGHAIDVLEIDGASHRGIEDIRQINETIGFTPANGSYKIYLIDEVHMLTKEAFNALLKTLEEPPAHAKFFFATTEVHKIPPTILSRCQRFNLGRIPLVKITEKLASIASDLKITVEPEALRAIAELSEGSLRDAESLFDQVIAFQEKAITAETVAEVLGLASRDYFFELDRVGDPLLPFEIAEKVFASGTNLSYFLEELLSHFRTLFLCKHNAPCHEREKEKYLASAKLYRPEQLLEILDLIMAAQGELKYALSERTALEMLLLRILRTHQRLSMESLVERLETLQQRLERGEPLEPKVPPPPKVESKPAKAPPQKKPKSSPQPAVKHTVQEQSRFDTVMRFAAKELNGSLKKT